MKEEAESKDSYEEVDRIEIEYFTDPLCCWSWAIEPFWRKFINENKLRIKWRYRMGVMIPEWKFYSDPINDVSRPAQMAPVWLQVKYSTNTEIDPDIWLFDPPQTSLVSCLAVKCAELQSEDAADIMLFILRKAVMTQKKNIARKEIIFELAKEAEKNYQTLNYEQFESDFKTNKALPSLKDDIQRTKLAEVDRFPTLIMKRSNQNRGIKIVGYKPYPVLEDAFRQLTDVLAKQH